MKWRQLNDQTEQISHNWYNPTNNKIPTELTYSSLSFEFSKIITGFSVNN